MMASEKARKRRWLLGNSPEAIAAWIACNEALEPVTMTDEEWEAWQQRRREDREWQMADQVEREKRLMRNIEDTKSE